VRPRIKPQGDFHLQADETGPGTAASFWKTQEFTAVQGVHAGCKDGERAVAAQTGSVI